MTITRTSCTQFRFTWPEVASNYQYSLDILDGTDLVTYTESTTDPGNSETVSISVANLLNTYNYNPGQTVTARLRQRVGNNGIFSDYLIASSTDVILTVPAKMATSVLVSSNRFNLTISWTPPATVEDRGGDTSVTYLLEMCKLFLGLCSSYTNVIPSLTTQTSNTYILKSSSFFGNEFVFAKDYYILVSCTNSCGTSVRSDFLNFTTYPAPDVPAQPTTLASTSVTNTQVIMSWNFMTTDVEIRGYAVTSYELSFALNGYTNWTVITSSNVNTFTQTTGFNLNSLYNYRLRAYNQLGWSAYSASVQINTPTTPQQVTGLAVSSISLTQIVLTWTALTTASQTGRMPITNYNVQWKLSTDSVWSQVGPTSGFTTNTYTITTAFAMNVTLNFQVRAENVVGAGTYSSTLAQLTPTVPNKMAAPTNTSINPSAIGITWTAFTQAYDRGYVAITDYQLDWQLQDTNTWATVITQLGTTATHIMTFGAGLYYQYRVRAQNQNGWGPYSNNLLIQADDIPKVMVVPTSTFIEPYTIKLSWTALNANTEDGRDTITYYQLDWDSGTSQTTWTELTSSGTATTFTHSSGESIFDPTKQFRYRVRAKNGVGSGPYSPLLIVQPDTAPTVSPAPSCSSITPTAIVLTWSAISIPADTGGDPITYYRVECDQGDGNGFLEITSQAAGVITTFTQISSLFPANTFFQYRIKSMNRVGYGPSSTVLSITTDTVPIKMSAPTIVSVDPTVIKITWTPLTADADMGRDAVTYYKVEYWPGSGTTWTEVSTSGTATSFTHSLGSIMFPVNTNVKYRISAKNNVGFGPVSDELIVLTDDVPVQVTPVVTGEITPVGITFTWTHSNTNPFNGRDLIINYKLVWAVDGTSNWVTLNTSPFMSQTFTVTSGFTINTLYNVKVAAENSVGLGPYSDPIQILTDNVPTRMNAPVEDPATNKDTVVTTWTGITLDVDTGRDPVIYYKLYWDQGSNSWQALTGSSNGLIYTFTQSSGIVAGTSYMYKLSAVNRVGEGTFSNTITIIPSSPPNQISSAAVASLSTNAVQIQITWQAPNNNGAAITAYDIQIQAKNGSWYQDLNGCDGSDAAIVSSTTCYSFMNNLRTQFGLLYSNLVVVKVRAYNLKGWQTLYSTANTVGATIETEPTQMTSPVKGSNTNYNVLHFSWTNLTTTANIGGSTASISSYHIQRNQGNNTLDATDVWTDLMGLSSNDTTLTYQTSASIVGGTTYKVRVRALNKYGWGLYSTYTSIRCARVPNPPTASLINTTNSTIYILIRWSPPFNNGLDITKYGLQIRKRDGVTWVNAPAGECDGANVAIVASTQCMILMQTLRSSTYGLLLNDQVIVQIRAYNDEGWGTYTKNTVGALMQTVPASPTNLIVNDITVTTDLRIQLSWTDVTALNSKGGIDLIAYEIQWTDTVFAQESIFNDTVPFKLQYLHVNRNTTPDAGNTPWDGSQPIVGGTTYKFKYRAYNIHGAGPFSSETIVIASTKPDQLPPPTTALVNNTVVVSWQVTPNDHKQAVKKYRIKFRQSSGSYTEETTQCDGSNAANFANMKCTINMIKLTSTPYSLVIDDLIAVQVEAYNIMGYSIPSLSNTDGVLAKKLPQIAPNNLARGANTGKLQVEITWTALTLNTETGGQVVDYKVYWDKGSGNWATLAESTNNLTTFLDNFSNYITGKAYSYKVAAWNDFGVGPQTNAFTVWTAIPPTGFSDPTSTLQYLTYVEEDDVVVIDWDPPIDNGGLAVSYSVDLLSKSGTWLNVVQTTECSERGTISAYVMPQYQATISGSQCTILVTNLKTKYGLVVGDTVLARVNASHVVGSIATTQSGAGTAVLPITPCFRTTFPRIIGGSIDETMVNAIDIDFKGNIAAGGYSKDSTFLAKTVTQYIPIVYYIAKGNYYVWAKYIETNDGTSTIIYEQVLDITFRTDGEKIALALDKANYDLAYMIVIMNKDGTLFSAYRENTIQRGKINITSMIFDSSNFVTAVLDLSFDGTSSKRLAQIMRFSVGTASVSSFTPQFLVQGGNSARLSQAFCLQRIRTDANTFYVAAMVQDQTQRRPVIARMSYASGQISRYVFYTASNPDYASDLKVPVVKRMNLWEDELGNVHIISACMQAMDGSRMYFGLFNILTTQFNATVVTPTVSVNQICLGIWQSEQNNGYALFNDRSANTPVGYLLYYARIRYNTGRMEIISVTNHEGNNNYAGARFLNPTRIYYWGQSLKQVTPTEFPYAKYVGFIHLMDPLEPSPTVTQLFTFSSTSDVKLDTIPSASMTWQASNAPASTGGSWFANITTGKTFRSQTLSGGITTLNLKTPLSNNTWSLVLANPTPPTITAPTVPGSVLVYDPEATSYPIQEMSFLPFGISRFCPDSLAYYGSFLYDISAALPSFVTFDPSNSKYQFAINQPSHVGMYYITIHATLGNNNTAQIYFTVQVASTCFNLDITVPTLPSVPTYDLSDLAPKFIDLNWQVSNPPQASCGPINFIFKLLNGTTGLAADSTVFSIINTTSGLQQLRIWTQAIPKAKLWSDIKIEARLQGDLVKTYTYTVLITNKCAVTQIVAIQQSDIIYYHGRDAINLQFVWSETVGLCGPITYVVLEYLPGTPSSNNSLEASVIKYPHIAGTDNTVRIFTADETRAGTYMVRVYASLGVGGFQQSIMIFTVQVIKDPCSYFPFVTPIVDDLTLWVNQTNQIVNIPPFLMNETIWVCNFTYEIRTPLSQPVEPMFLITEQVVQGTGPKVQLVTSDITKADLSPYSIRVRGWPQRQMSTVSQQMTFRVFIAYLVKTDCSSGYYYNSTSDNCQPCVSPCLTCKSYSECTWCVTGYSLNEASATCQLNTLDCPAGTIKDIFFGICRKCPEFCATCSDYSNCTSCIPNYNLGRGQCYPPRYCAPGFRFDNGLCLACLSNCEACAQTSFCTYCMENYYLDTLSGQCTQNCPKGYYGDLYSRTCMICSPACASCVTNNYTCTSCRDIGAVQYYLYKSTCVTRCPYSNIYQNQGNRSCDPCKPECKICVNAIDDCIVCNEGSVISGRSCLNSCPPKSYITVIGTCFNCDPACQNCYGPQNSMCTQCVAGQYLTQTTCEPKCNDPFFPYDVTRTCRGCTYYCKQCTTATNCLKCKPGYKQEPLDCSGEWFLRTTTNFSLPAPINATMIADLDPTVLTVEIWFKSDNIGSVNLEVILGLFPYKLRKKSGISQVHLTYGSNFYCDSWNLRSDTWYHFAFAMQEDGFKLNCYVNGDQIQTGLVSTTIISSNVERLKEINFGGTNFPTGFESRFNGYLKEFRWWNAYRTAFLIKNFMTVAFIEIPKTLFSYWRLDEKKTDTIYRDSVGMVWDPSPKTISQTSDMREIFLKICPEGTYSSFNETLGFYDCTSCHELCKNCNGNSSSNCTECNFPYKLIQAEQICVIVEGCPNGYFQDSKTDSCQPCHDYCITCINTPYQCPKCKAQYFKQYKGLGCVDSCPRGLYGNYLTQSCSANPVITSLYPNDNSVFKYGSFIDLTATYELKNGEPSYSYSIGWEISILSSGVNLAGDAAKPYSDGDLRRVHIDNNIIQSNKYYNITFFVRGNPLYYSGMLGSTFIVIYIGIAPKNGKCDIFPPVGVAGATEYWARTYDWEDNEGISEFRFYYSFDQGETYIAFPQASRKSQEVRYKFPPVYQAYKMLLKCEVMNLKGFDASITAPFVLNRKSNANAKSDLAKTGVDWVQTESDSLAAVQTLQQLTQELGQVDPPQTTLFDPKIDEDKCLDEICSFGGKCIYRPIEKKYYCQCKGQRAGQNCTFRNRTELEQLRALNKNLTIRYLSGLDLPERRYELQFMKLASSYVDLLDDDMVDMFYPILFKMAQNIDTTKLGASEAESLTQVLSNMVEYLQYSILVNNVTGGWGTSRAEKEAWVNENLSKTYQLSKKIQNSTLYQLGPLNTQVQVQSRTVAYRQVLASTDKILSMPATTAQKGQQSFVKISQSNFIGSPVQLNPTYIASVTEYSQNPFPNVDMLSSNILEIELYNQNRSVIANNITRVLVHGLVTPIEVSFAVADSQNLSLFVRQFNLFNVYKNAERLKRVEMVLKSGLTCVYWDPPTSRWRHDGCALGGIDSTHIKCECTHLTAFAILFMTPRLTIDAPLLENSTVSAQSSEGKELQISDIVRWPLDLYVKNLQEIWQHNRPSLLSFLLKPGAIVLGLYWAMYFSSLIYYTGRDQLKRDKMTKGQNRDDLAEMKNDEVQNLHQVIKDLIVRDFFRENERFIKKQQLDPEGRIRAPPSLTIYEELSREERKKLKKRARAKVLGMPGGLWDRAARVYRRVMKRTKEDPNAKMALFYEELKNNLWIGLIAKTSKIAPRHVRLTLMYFYAAVYISILTIVFAFQLQEAISEVALVQVVVLSLCCLVAAWLVAIPVALIFRMPLANRRLVAGVRTKKINKAFREVDKLMGRRYAVGYFICYSVYGLMSVLVVAFNTFYPRDYVVGWAFNILLLYLFDLVVFTFALAALQLANVAIAQKLRRWYRLWAAIEVFRYLKNLRG